MKPIKQRWLAAFFSAAIFLLSLTACTPQVAKSSSGEISPNEVSSSTPQGTQSESNKSATSFGYGFNIQFPGSMIGEKEGTAVLVREFEYTGGELKANMYLSSNPGQIAELGILIFCDGVPTEYTLLDSGETGFFHVFQVEGEQTVKISLKPDFDLGLGRIDFHVTPRPSEKGSVMRNGIIPVHAVLPEGYQAEDTYSNVIGDVETTQIIALPEKLKSTQSVVFTGMFVVDSVEEMAGSGSTAYEIEGREETRIGVCIPAPGTYRLTFLLDGKPAALVGEKTVLTCEFGEDEMFSAEVPLKKMLSAGEHSLQVIATRVDEQSFETEDSCRFLSSFRVEIIN